MNNNMNEVIVVIFLKSNSFIKPQRNISKLVQNNQGRNNVVIITINNIQLKYMLFNSSICNDGNSR